ncbi:hypothetical protein [Rodentibacter caecimuris]|nr:hypothetical protein [Rodentibacter heylii]MCQ9124328.1 hypothetical protein [Rodentibacter heylii]
MIAEFHFEDNKSVRYLTNLHINKQDGFKVVRIIENNVIEKYELLEELFDDETIQFLLLCRNKTPKRFEALIKNLNESISGNNEY